MMINRKPLLAIWIALVASLGADVTDSMSAPTIQGTASVIDGDTIELPGERIRLDAIDAPESSQLCLDAAGKRYRCGQKSAFALANMIGRSVVSCLPGGRDRYKRVIAICFKGPINLNAWIVSQGWAVAFGLVLSRCRLTGEHERNEPKRRDQGNVPAYGKLTN